MTPRALQRLLAAASAAEAHPFAHVRFRRVHERLVDGVRPLARNGIGVVDFRGWRCAVDFGAYGLLFKDGRLWEGASIASLSELGNPITPWAATPLTLLAFAEAATGAEEAGTELVADEECVRMRATADLARLSAAHRPVPMPLENLPDPSRVPFDAVVSASGALRRMRWQSAYQPIFGWGTWFELDLVAFADQVAVDWTRMPEYTSVEDDIEISPERVELLERLIGIAERLGASPGGEMSAELDDELTQLGEELKRLGDVR